LQTNIIYNEDCLLGMQRLPDGSVDMILCDLPYGTTRCKWDSVIPFEPLWEQYKRVAKKNAAIVLTASQPFTSALVVSNSQMFKYDWTWRKPKGTGHLNAKKQPLRDKEDVLVFYREQCTYNPQFSEGQAYSGMKRIGKKQQTSSYGTYQSVREDNDGKRYPKQILEFPVVERGTIHPTQKPVALFEYLIRTYTNKCEMVLDNCMGSATTAIACLNTGRKYVGFEKDKTYFQSAQRRIAKHTVQPSAAAA
jgi:DNA modification methylase